MPRKSNMNHLDAVSACRAPYSNANAYSIVQNLLEDGIISLGDILNSSNEEDVMKSILKAVHRYAIKKTPDGRYTTYIPDANKPGGRRQIRRKSKTDLYRFLLQYYGVGETGSKRKMTYAELFPEWVDYKRLFIGATNKKRSLSPSTIRRYERDYEKYIKGSPLENVFIDEVTPPNLEMMLLDIIQRFSMPEKSAGNLLGQITQSFAYARRQEYITRDPSSTIDRQLLLSKCRFNPPKDDADCVLSLSEMSDLLAATIAHEKLHPTYMPDYAIELSLMTGMRAGEIAVLHWHDIDDNFIHVDFSEHRNDYSDRPSELVVAEPKNGKHRKYPMTDEIAALFTRVRAIGLTCDEDFIFVREDGSRYSGHDIGCAVVRRAHEAGIDKTSIHEIRRTVSSMLNEVLPQKAVASMLGHSERVNERHYNFSTTENTEKAAALSTVSSKVIKFRNDYVPKKMAGNAD